MKIAIRLNPLSKNLSELVLFLLVNWLEWPFFTIKTTHFLKNSGSYRFFHYEYINNVGISTQKSLGLFLETVTVGFQLIQPWGGSLELI